jgi:hypothetical protein
MNPSTPPYWKSLDDIAAGIDANRLPRTDKLTGTGLVVIEQGRAPLRLEFRTGNRVSWRRDDVAEGTDWYEAVESRADVHYLTITDATRPMRACVLIVNRTTGRTLTVTSIIADRPIPGRPRVSQHIRPGVIDGVVFTGDPPAPTRALIGLRMFHQYSPDHLYEHTYLSSQRYAWQCLVGPQRGHAHVDLASTWRLADDLYVFTTREFLNPIGTTWLYDLQANRSTGTLIGLRANGTVMVVPGGAFITPLDRITYPEHQPV